MLFPAGHCHCTCKDKYMPDLVTCTTNVKLRTANALRNVAQVKEDTDSGQNVWKAHPQDI